VLYNLHEIETMQEEDKKGLTKNLIHDIIAQLNTN
jgi:hypothetical protein